MAHQHGNEPIAIIGSGCRFPGGASSPSRLWDLLMSPPDLSKRIPHDRFNPSTFYHEDGEHHGTSNIDKSYFLEEDVRKFDAMFFSMAPKEAETVDPQHRILLEVVFEGLEDAGLSMQELHGSGTSVFVGTMTQDYAELQYRDPQMSSQYVGTGTANSILSNRVSYFYNWSGPSMTIDTACSSSLVAVHLAVQSLRSRESDIACAAGSNIILGPERYIAQSSLHMLSPTGKSRMWDVSADGYARGEGVACVFLKRLSDAIADGDKIDAILRETGVNSDGRTKGITMPSARAQARLIQETYAKAGLDPHSASDRCQYFEAHGTGTQAGDPQEAEAISSAFFPQSIPQPDDANLFVGSIKTVIGHTEGAAGVAGLIKVMESLKHGRIAKNLHFENLNPSVEPFYTHLTIPQQTTPWPEAPGGVRRASINSFGFGGTNAHAIVEEYNARKEPVQSILPRPSSEQQTMSLPLFLSAMSEKSLKENAMATLAYLRSCNAADFSDALRTYRCRRSHLPIRTAIVGRDREEIVSVLEKRISESSTGLGSRSSNAASPKILGIFTGQGAQWPRMGKELMGSNAVFAETLDQLQEILAALPDAPSWSIKEQLLADAATSRIHEAEISQPICTIIQIALVNALRANGVKFDTVLGHSSGEIGAAYAAGILSARDALCIAYYRGLAAKYAQDPKTGAKGSMIAVGLGNEEAQAFCAQERYNGRLSMAASNSPTSTTLSGDATACHEALKECETGGIFARMLKVSTAYHSVHMTCCSKPYMDSLSACVIKPQAQVMSGAPVWISSVFRDQAQIATVDLEGPYWNDNMCRPVLFREAVETAVNSRGPFDMVIEVGPHQALRGPALQTIKATSGDMPPYTGTLDRGKHDFIALNEALTSIWTKIGSAGIDIRRMGLAFSGQDESSPPARNLPAYSWDHSQDFWRAYRINHQFLNRDTGPHELLGMRSHDDSANEMRWRNILKDNEISWLDGHRFQGQIIVPAAAYLIMAVEAAKAMAMGSSIQVVEVQDMDIESAITMGENSPGVEILFTLTRVFGTEQRSDLIEAHFALQSSPVESTRPLRSNCRGRVLISLGASADPWSYPSTIDVTELREVSPDEFYEQMQSIGLSYTGPFNAITSAQRRGGTSQVNILKPSPHDTTTLPISPAMVDSCLQAGFIAFSAPGDLALWTSFLPRSIKSARFNLACCEARSETDNNVVQVEAHVTRFDRTTQKEAARIAIDLEVRNDQGQIELIMEEVVVASFSKGSPEDDRELYRKTVWKPAIVTFASEVRCSEAMRTAISDLDHISASLQTSRTPRLIETSGDSRPRSSMVEHVDRSHNVDLELNDEEEQRPDFVLLKSLSHHLRSTPRVAPLGLEVDQTVLVNFFQRGIAAEWISSNIMSAVSSISHRFANLNIIEFSNGYASVANRLADNLGTALSSLTLCAPSVASLEASCGSDDVRIIKRTFSFEDDFATSLVGPYDVVLVNDILHAAPWPALALRQLRGVLRTGGYLIVAQPNVNSTFQSTIRPALSYVWPGDSAQNEFGRSYSLADLDEDLIQASFSGIDQSAGGETTDVSLGHVAVSTATDDFWDRFARPLQNAGSQSSDHMTLVVGGTTTRVAKLARAVTSWLSSGASSVTQIRRMEDLESAITPDTTSAVILSDLDGNVLADINGKVLKSMQTLFSSVANVLWITSGALSSNPYHSATWGMTRSIRDEHAELNIQMVDVDRPFECASFIAETLRKLELSASPEYQGLSPLWTVEREMIFRDNQVTIPRVFPDHERNARLNSQRRAIRLGSVLGAGQILELVQTDGVFQPQLCLPFPEKVSDESSLRQIKVDVSSVLPLRTSAGLRWLVAGSVDGTLEHVLGLARVNASTVTLAADEIRIVPRTTDLVTEFARTWHNMLDLAVKCGLWSTGIAIYDPAMLDTTHIERFCQRNQLPLFKVCQNKQKNMSRDHWQPLNIAALPKRIVIKTLGRYGTILDRSDNPQLASMSSLLDLAGTKVYSQGELDLVCTTLTPQSLLAAGTASDGELQKVDATMKIHRISDGPIRLRAEPFAAVEWTQGVEVEYNVQHASSALKFPSNKSYLLVGLAGELGESITRDMFAHGARHFTICSRRPKSFIAWVQDLRQLGADISVVPMDVSNPTDVQRVYDSMKASGVPIGGIINGAMVIADAVFANMSVENFNNVMRPKVSGTMNLDQVSRSDDLDLFIVLSSLSSVVGNPGQSNYSAANMFMAGLVAQRRARGLAATCLDIGMLIGIGFVRRSGQEAVIYGNLRRQGYMVESESDFLESFAEAVLAGRDGDAFITTGLAQLPTESGNRHTWYSEPKFSHHSRSVVNDVSAVDAGSMSLVEKIATAPTTEAAVDILMAAFATQLETMMGLSKGSVPVGSPFVEMGLDSLMAVEVRNWILKTFDYDLPVLEIMGDGTIASISAKIASRRTITSAAPREQASPPTVQVVQPAAAPAAMPSPMVSERTTGMSTPLGTSEATSRTSMAGDDEATGNETKQTVLGDVHWHELLFDRVEDILPSQRRFLHFTDSSAANVTVAYRMEGPLSRTRLERAIGLTVGRHSIFRTSFVQDAQSSSTKQAIAHHSRAWLRRSRGEEHDVAAEIARAAKTPLNIAVGETFYAELVDHQSGAGDLHTLIITWHNAIMDGLSWGVFLEDLIKLYADPSLQLPVPRQFVDVPGMRKAWLDSKEAHDRARFWPQEFDNAPMSLPLLPMSKVERRQESANAPGSVSATLIVEKPIASAIRASCQASKVSGFHFYFATMATMLSSYLGITDCVIGIVDSGRMEAADMTAVGMFTDYLPVRSRIAKGSTFRDLLTTAKVSVTSSLSNALPFSTIKGLLGQSKEQDDDGEPPCFQVLLNYRLGALRESRLGSIRLEPCALIESELPFDMVLTIDEEAATDTLILTFAMRDYLFDKSAPNLVGEQYVRHLETFATNLDTEPRIDI